MALNDIYESTSTFLKAADLAGAKPIVTIETAEVVENEFDDGKKKQIVLTFHGKEKKLGLNFTNAAKLAELIGTEEHEEWVGVSIKLYVEKVKFQNRLVDAIRIFPELPQGQAVAAPAQQFTGKPQVQTSTNENYNDPDEVAERDAIRRENEPVDVPW